MSRPLSSCTRSGPWYGSFRPTVFAVGFSYWCREMSGRRPSTTRAGVRRCCGPSSSLSTGSLLETQTIPPFQALNKELRDRAAELGTRRGVPAEALNQLIQGADEPGSFADLVAFYLDLPTADKQKLLEVLDDEERMRRALVAVERELARIEAQEEIQAKVQEELGERQREMLLREQMKQIQHELGGEDEKQEIDDLGARIEALDLEEEARGRGGPGAQALGAHVTPGR